MSRRQFLKDSLFLGTLFIPTYSISSSKATIGHRIRVSLYEPLGFSAQVLAQKYLLAMRQSLNETGLVLDDENIVKKEKPDKDLQGELYITSEWTVGSALPFIASTSNDQSDALIGVIDESALCIASSRFLPKDWTAMQHYLLKQGNLISLGLSSQDDVSEKMAEFVFASIASLKRPLTYFRGGDHLYPALVGGRVDLAIFPMSVSSFVGRPGGYEKLIQLNQSGDLNLLSIASEKRLIQFPDMPTLNELLGQSHLEVVLSTLIRYSGPTNDALLNQLRTISKKITGS